MGKIRDQIPPEAMALGSKLAAEEHQRFVDSGKELSEVILEPDETLGVYTLRLSNKERIMLRQLAVKTGRPATEIARDFIRQGIQQTLSPKGKIRPESELGIRHLAFIAQSLSSFVESFELDELKALAEERGKKESAKPTKPSRKRA